MITDYNYYMNVLSKYPLLQQPKFNKILLFENLNSINKKHILLTSTGFTNKKFEKLFINNIRKPINKVRVIFVPTAAIDKESKSILPECKKDLTNAGVLKQNIITYDLDYLMDINELSTFDAIYFCGGSENHLMKAINKIGFKKPLLNAINDSLFFIGVSAGSMIASNSVKNNLGIIPNKLEPHCEKDITPDGPLPPRNIQINLSDDQAVWITNNESVIIS